MRSKERKYKKTETTELLNFVAGDIPYENDKERDNQNDMKEELENRPPFEAMRMKMDRMQREVNDLRKSVGKLLEHEHSAADGKPVIPIVR